MADSKDRSGKPPAITVRPESWEDYDRITAAAARKKMSRGEWLLAGGLQRLTGGPIRPSRRELREQAKAQGGALSSAEAKANVRAIPKSGR
jgi:hypothetical protein